MTLLCKIVIAAFILAGMSLTILLILSVLDIPVVSDWASEMLDPILIPTANGILIGTMILFIVMTIMLISTIFM